MPQDNGGSAAERPRALHSREDQRPPANGWPPLVNRKAECQAIHQALDGTGLPHVIIAGPPGLGRTRLAREALTIAHDRGRRTRWATATEASAMVPLGALAHLLPPVAGDVTPLGLLQQTVQTLTGGGGDEPPVLLVDDVHHLDQLSVGLLHQLSAGTDINLMLTVRTSNSTPDPVAHLWKDGLATRLELQPLPREDADLLLVKALGGDVETRTSERLWRLGRGNPLFAFELLAEGRRAGLLRQRAGVWRWEGPMRPSQRLAEIALAQLGDLDEAQWRVLEVLAVTEPLSIDGVVELSSPAAVASLVRRGVVVERSEGDARVLESSHPLHTAVVRDRTSAVTLQTISQRLTELRSLPSSPEELRVSSAVLLDKEHATQDPELLTEAARRANALLDHPLAERLARAGIEAGGGATAHLALVEAAQWQGEPARSELAAVQAAAVAAGQDEHLAQLAAMRAISLYFGLNHATEAFSVLREAAASVRSEKDRALLTATEASLTLLDGIPERAVQQAFEVLEKVHGDGIARPLAAAVAAGGLAVTGRTGRALELVRSGWDALGGVPAGPEVGYLWLALAQAEALALRYAGSFHRLQRRAAELQAANLAAPQWAGDAVIALYRGCAALVAGRPGRAIRWLSEALAGLGTSDPTGNLPLCLAELAMARAMVGDVQPARDIVGEPGGRFGLIPPLFRPQACLAEAWLAAADGHTEEAAARCVEAAAVAGTMGQRCVEALMLHAAARFGAATAVLPRLALLAGEVDSPLVAVCAAHVDAAVAGDGARLDEVSDRFEEMGALLLAAEAATDAAVAHQARGDRPAAGLSRATASALTRRCEVPRAPGLPERSPVRLTAREQEVAHLAARGQTNQDIAAHLVVSVRTVETHLAHVYAKLGISSRRSLAELLG